MSIKCTHPHSEQYAFVPRHFGWYRYGYGHRHGYRYGYGHAPRYGRHQRRPAGHT